MKIFGVDGMDGILNVENFDKSLAEGVMLLTPFSATGDDEATVKFVKAYGDANNGETPNQFAADTYDVLYAMQAAANDAAYPAPNSPVPWRGAAVPQSTENAVPYNRPCRDRFGRHTAPAAKFSLPKGSHKS